MIRLSAVRTVLALRRRRTVGARAAADRVELVEPFENALRVYRPNGLNGFGDVETSTLFVSR